MVSEVFGDLCHLSLESALCLCAWGNVVAGEGDVEHQGSQEGFSSQSSLVLGTQHLDTAEKGFGPCIQLCVVCFLLLIRHV